MVTETMFDCKYCEKRVALNSAIRTMGSNEQVWQACRQKNYFFPRFLPLKMLKFANTNADRLHL